MKLPLVAPRALAPAFGKRKFRWLPAVAMLGLAVWAAGCANLRAVRDFAAEAKTLSSSSEVRDDLLQTNLRRQALYGREESSEALAGYRDYQERFEQTQGVLTAYFGALTAVADDEVVNYRSHFTTAAAAANKVGVLEKKDADLVASALNFVAKLATDASRRRLLRESIERCEPAVQKLVEAMIDTLQEDYLRSLEAERQAARSLVADVDASANPGLARLARYTLRDHAAALDGRTKAAEAYVAALRKIAAAHAQLARQLGDFSAKQIVAELKGYQADLKDLQRQLKP